jgi:phage-related protein
MALPTLGTSSPLADSAKDLKDQLAEVSKQMEKVSGKDAEDLINQLKEIGKQADAQGPKLKKLFATDPNAAKALRTQFQGVIDKAVEMAAKVKEKSEEAAQQARIAGTKRAGQAVGMAGQAARGGGISGSQVGEMAGAAFGPEGAAVGEVIGKVADEIKAATDAIWNFAAASVQASNPGVWDRYQRAVQNMGAVFGRAFAPLVEEATHLTDQLNGALSEIAPVIGDIVQSLVSDFKPVMEAVVELAQDAAKAFKYMWAFFGPVVKDIAASIGAVVAAVGEAYAEVWSAFIDLAAQINSAFTGILPTIQDVMKDIAAAIVVAVKAAGQLLDILLVLGRQFAQGGKFDIGAAVKEAAERRKQLADAAKDAAGNRTLAARPAEFSAIEDIGRKVQQAAASTGSGAQGKDQGENIADIADRANAIAGFFGDLVGKVSVMAAKVDYIAERLANGIEHPATEGKKAIGQAIYDVGGKNVGDFFAGIGHLFGA